MRQINQIHSRPSCSSSVGHHLDIIRTKCLRNTKCATSGFINIGRDIIICKLVPCLGGRRCFKNLVSPLLRETGEIVGVGGNLSWQKLFSIILMCMLMIEIAATRELKYSVLVKVFWAKVDGRVCLMQVPKLAFES